MSTPESAAAAEIRGPSAMVSALDAGFVAVADATVAEAARHFKYSMTTRVLKTDERLVETRRIYASSENKEGETVELHAVTTSGGEFPADGSLLHFSVRTFGLEVHTIESAVSAPVPTHVLALRILLGRCIEDIEQVADRAAQHLRDVERSVRNVKTAVWGPLPTRKEREEAAHE